MNLLLGQRMISKYFSPKKLTKKDKKRYLKNINPKSSLDFQTSRTLISFSPKKQKWKSISHKDGNAALLFGKKKVGVDMEKIIIRDNLFDLFCLFANQKEIDLFRTLQPNEQLFLFYELFTLKETLIKLGMSDFFQMKELTCLPYHIPAENVNIKIKSYPPTTIIKHKTISLQVSAKFLTKPQKIDAHFCICSFDDQEYLICCATKRVQNKTHNKRDKFKSMKINPLKKKRGCRRIKRF